MSDLKVPPYIRTEREPRINKAGTLKYSGGSPFIDSLRESIEGCIEECLISLKYRKASRKSFKRRRWQNVLHINN